MIAAAKASLDWGARQCGTDSRKKRFAQEKKVCEMRQACSTGTSYDPEPISGEATPKRAKGKSQKAKGLPEAPPPPLAATWSRRSRYLAATSSTHTASRCLRQEPGVQMDTASLRHSANAPVLVYCCPVFFSLIFFLFLIIRSLISYFCFPTTFGRYAAGTGSYRCSVYLWGEYAYRPHAKPRKTRAYRHRDAAVSVSLCAAIACTTPYLYHSLL
ncbi:hypothetical protein ACQKWADRAFT_255668 [Trichoderma austrokoningii]